MLLKTTGEPVTILRPDGEVKSFAKTTDQLGIETPVPGLYTVVMGALSTHAVNPSLYPKMPYDANKDFAPITLVATTPNVLVVNPALPVNSVKELVAYAKANPGKVAFGSGSNGSAEALDGEMRPVFA